jgi:hypothetical protein
VTTLKAFVGALVRRWISKFLFLLAGFSTVATYIPGFIPGFSVPRWVPLLFFVVAFFVGSFDLYRNQLTEITQLRSDISRLHAESKKACLVLGIHGRSAFFRHAPDRGIVVGIYLHLDVSVENKGTRASVISKYHLTIREIGEEQEVRPRGFSSIQGPLFTWAVETARRNLALDGYIRVQPDSLAGPEILPFYVAAVPPADCHLLHGILRVSDTNDEHAELNFELSEHG